MKMNVCMKSQDLRVLLSKIWQCVYILCNSLLTYQMALSFNINNYFSRVYFCCKTKLRVGVSDRQGKHAFAQDYFYF